MMKPAPFLGAIALSLALAATARAEEPTADTVVATVNGTEITLGHMIVLRDSLPQQYLQLDDQTLFDAILDQIVQQAALADATGTDLRKRDMLALENYKRSYLAGAAIDEVAQGAITDEQVKALYDEKFAAAEPLKEFNAAHILVETEDEAKAIKAEIEGGADFEATAREKSTGPSGPNGGNLGWFSAGMMVKPFEDAVMAMEAGQVSDPVETQFGWHIIKLNEVRTAAMPTIDEARGDLVEELRSSAVETRLEEATKAATIEKSVEGIDPAILKNSALLDN